MVTAQVTRRACRVEVTGEGAAAASAGEQHLVVRAMRPAFARLGGQPPGLALSCRNEIPQGFGLGSSAGAIVRRAAGRAGPGRAGGRAALPDAAVLALATEFEGHPDNVAACLAGGLTIAWQPSGPAGLDGPPEARVARLEPLAGIDAGAVRARRRRSPTVTARQVLPAQVPHADAAANSARAALLVAALTSQTGLLMDATEDFLHQGYRAAAMPATARADRRAAGRAAPGRRVRRGPVGAGPDRGGRTRGRPGDGNRRRRRGRVAGPAAAGRRRRGGRSGPLARRSGPDLSGRIWCDPATITVSDPIPGATLHEPFSCGVRARPGRGPP